MKKTILALLLVILFSTPALAKNTPEEILVLLPLQIESFIAQPEPITYSDKRLGASLGYNAPDQTVITVYLYDQGIQDIKDGIDSEIIQTSRETSMEEMKVNERMGYWRNVKKITDEEIEFNIGKKDLKVLYVSYSCDANDGYSEKGIPLISDLYVTGLKNYICKIRITRLADSDEAKSQNVIEAILAEINNN